MNDDDLRDERAVVRTHPVNVRVFLRDGATVEGKAHIKPGAYQRRVSDLLNGGKVQFIAITEATYKPQGGESAASDCVLVNVDDVAMLDATPHE